MLHPLGANQTGPCVWMTAGLLTYKLCDRNFDCERCPLDAAFRREPPADSALHPLLLPHVVQVFPNDRLYSVKHLWVQIVEGPTASFLRVGLDAFAAAVIGFCRGVGVLAGAPKLQAGETLARVDVGIGVLPLGAPVAGAAKHENPLLERNPALVVSQPYGSGWIVDLEGDPATARANLLPARAAREHAMGDLRRLRHRVATQLLVEEGGKASMADGGEMVCDLREMLGGANYLELLKELIN